MGRVPDRVFRVFVIPEHAQNSTGKNKWFIPFCAKIRTFWILQKWILAEKSSNFAWYIPEIYPSKYSSPTETRHYDTRLITNHHHRIPRGKISHSTWSRGHQERCSQSPRWCSRIYWRGLHFVTQIFQNKLNTIPKKHATFMKSRITCWYTQKSRNVGKRSWHA